MGYIFIVLLVVTRSYNLLEQWIVLLLLGYLDPHRPAPESWQNLLAPVQHFVRREMTMIHLETTSPPEVVSSREITQNIRKNLLYKLTQGIFLKYKTHRLRSTKL